MKVMKIGGIYKAEKRIKIKNLFTMTSGMRYDTTCDEIAEGKKMTDGICPTVEMMKYLAKMPLEFEPGEKWRYSFSHDVIAALVEVVSGMRFGEYVKKTIFDPLGMNDTTYLLPDEKLDRVCSQYRFDKNENKYINVGKLIQNYKLGSEYESGGAGAVSTVKDYIKFLEGIRVGKVLNEQTLAEMQKNYLREDQFGCYWGAHRYGYGLGVRVPLGDGKRTDFGWGGAAGAFAAVDPTNNITVYYSQHVLSSPFAQV